MRMSSCSIAPRSWLPWKRLCLPCGCNSFACSIFSCRIPPMHNISLITRPRTFHNALGRYSHI